VWGREIHDELQRALRDHAGRIKHDLGKYVAFQVRWLQEDAEPAAMREALCADLLATRRGPEGSVDALTLWSSFRQELVGGALLEGAFEVDLSEDPAFRDLDAAVSALEPFVAALRAGESVDVSAARAAALAVAEACKRFLHATREM
jgi:hypothetical protein